MSMPSFETRARLIRRTKMTTETRTTLADLEAAIDEYETARLREDAARKDKEAARDRIIQAFKEGGMRTYRDSKQRVTTVDTRYSKRISYKEAEAMLDADTLKKLTQESTYLVVNVRYKPELKEE
jgi:phage-related minor tail protein